MLAIDGPEFRKQRQYLCDLVDATQKRGRPDEALLLNGLQNLCDSIADQAFDNYGIDGLMRPEDGGELHAIIGYVTRKSVPNEVLRELFAESLQESLQRVQDDPQAMLAVMIEHADATKLRQRIIEKVTCPKPSPPSLPTEPCTSDASTPSTAPPEPSSTESDPTPDSQTP